MTDPLRIGPLAPEDREPRTAELLTAMRGGFDGDDLNLFATLAHHPRLLKRWSSFGGTLLFRGALSARDRELLILRTAAITGAEYEWGHHVELALAAGLSRDEIDRVYAGPDRPGWSTDDAALLQAADELHHEQRISDATWAALAARLDVQQLIEVPMLVGQYHLVAFTLRSLGVQPEPGVVGFPPADAPS